MFYGGATFPGGSTFSRGGGGGVQLLIPMETYSTCDFPGVGVKNAVFLDPRML